MMFLLMLCVICGEYKLLCDDGIQGDNSFLSQRNLDMSLHFVPMWFPFFKEQGASSYYCINSYCKSPCIFSVAVRDRFEEAVSYIQNDGHHSPSFTKVKGKSYHTPVQIHEKQITRGTGGECTFQLGFKSMIH